MGDEALHAAHVAHGILADIAAVRSGRPAPPIAAEEQQAVEDAQATPDLGRPVRVFVSWAHSDEDWDDEHRQAWERKISAFTTILRTFGIDADVDLYHSHETVTDWTRFGQAGVERADFVVVANSKGWSERWSGRNTPTVGAGAVGEADTLKGLFAEDQQVFQRKTLIVRLPGPGRTKIPPDLARLNHFDLDPDAPGSFEDLLRALTGQAKHRMPELGQVPVLPPVVSASIGIKKLRRTSKEFSDYLAVRDEVDRTEAEEERDPNPDVQARLATLMGLLDALQQ